MPVNKRDVVRIVKAGASGTEKDALLALAGEKPGLWDGLEEDDVLGVLRHASSTTGTLLTATPAACICLDAKAGLLVLNPSSGMASSNIIYQPC